MLKRARFGAASEKLDTQIEQLELIVEELEAGQIETAGVNDELPPSNRRLCASRYRSTCHVRRSRMLLKHAQHFERRSL